MPTVYLVRHAKPAAPWHEAADPGLELEGQSQAIAAAARLQPLGPLPVYTSPLLRCVETARPLAELWRRAATPLLAVAEIPAPPLDLVARGRWLQAEMNGTWSQLQASAPPGSPDYGQWRLDLLQALRVLPTDSVVFTHYVAINVAVGAAQGHDRVLSFRPAHASITALQIRGEKIIVQSLGEQADSVVLVGGKA
jgi:broad specificity phosphatase PhoE